MAANARSPSFSAAYVLGEQIGLTIYMIDEDGSLEGAWTLADQAGFGTERLVPVN